MERNKIRKMLRETVLKEDEKYGSSVINIDREIAHNIIMNYVSERKREEVYKSVSDALEQDGRISTHLEPEEEREILWQIGEAAVEDLLIAAAERR